MSYSPLRDIVIDATGAGNTMSLPSIIERQTMTSLCRWGLWRSVRQQADETDQE